MFDLPQPPKPNCVPHFFCEYCALCQEYRELKSRGWDPSVGRETERGTGTSSNNHDAPSDRESTCALKIKCH
ncbi:hypothetical protein WN943_014259 [Citrus x changshan-huyou]